MKVGFLFAALVLGAATLWAQDGSMMKSGSGTGSDGSMMKADSSMAGNDGSMMKADPMMKPDPMMDSSAYDLTGLGPRVIAFTSEAAAWTLAKKQNVVYFFAATWCPDCQATYKNLKANLAQIPATMTLVVVNYDKSSDLKKKYGITTQHSFVKVGTKGEKLKAWVGTTMVADIVKNATGM